MKVFENKKFNLDIPCDTTITGSCEYKKTFQECIASCTPSSECFWGYYDVKTKKCTAVNINSFKGLNPFFTLESSPGTTSFIDPSKFEIPAERHNCIYMYDAVNLIEQRTGKIFDPTILLISPKPYTRRPKNYIPMKLGEPFLIFDKSNDRILSPLEITVTWNKSLKYLHEDYEEFYLEPVNGSVLCYNNFFRIKTAYNAYLYYTGRGNSIANLHLGSFRDASIFRLEKTEYVPEAPTYY